MCRTVDTYLNATKMYVVRMEVVYQVALQIIVLLLTKTETATTSGLQTFFKQTSVLGIDSTVILREILKSNTYNLLSFLSI